MMRSDKVFLQNLTTAYVVKGEKFFQVRIVTQGIPLMREVTSVPDYIEGYLKAQASVEIRLRDALKEVSKLKVQLMIADRKKERAEKTVNNYAKWSRVRNAIIAFIIICIVAALPGSNAFLNPPYETNCETGKHTGCLIAPVGSGYKGPRVSYADVKTFCEVNRGWVFGRNQIDYDYLVESCIKTKGFGKAVSSQQARENCVEYYKKYLTRVICVQPLEFDFGDLHQRLMSEMTNFEDFLKSLQFVWQYVPVDFILKVFSVASLIVQWICHPVEDGASVRTLVLITMVSCLMLMTRVPAFMVAVLMHYVNIYTFACALICYWGGFSILTCVVVILHWVVMTLVAIFYSAPGKLLEDILMSGVMTCLIIAWNCVVRIIIISQLPIWVQVILAVTIANIVAVMRWVYSSDTNQKAPKIVAVPHNAVKRIINWQRGIIPPQTDISERVVTIVAGDKIGTGFRYMNYILTAGHVVGEDKVVEIRWKNFSCQANVKGHIDLPECPDTLAKISLPAGLANIKPLKLSKADTSCYGSLTSFDENRTTVQTMQGWLIFDGNWIGVPFDTRPGHSGSPYCDKDGRLIGIHLGSQALLGAGYRLNTILQSGIDIVKQQSLDEDDIVRKVIKGVQVSFGQLCGQLEELSERIYALEENQNMVSYVPFVQAGRNRNKRRNDRLYKRFSKMKVLTEEQYRELQEKGVSPETIRSIVDQLRQTALEEFLMDDDDDYYNENAVVRVVEKTPTQTKTLKYNSPNEEEAKKLFDEIVKTSKVKEGVTTHALYTDENTNIEKVDLEVDLKKVKIPDGEKEHTTGNTDTVVVKTKDGPIVIKRKTTNKVDVEKEEQGSDSGSEEVVQKEAAPKKRKSFECPICDKTFERYHDVEKCAEEQGYEVVKGRKNRKSPQKKN
uniref:Nonstructural protein 1a n=1 Tax=Avastrovirus sp. TaxID=2809168 RepID=A0AA48X9C8_9VIRU|nr:nonstructural protein 1a [Avastrovirus sp.]